MRIGIFGGSFDPIHFGHLILADVCREHLQLDQVRLIPAAQSPLKPGGAVASGESRARMVELAIAGVEGLAVDRLELERGGVSYTADTLAALQRRQADAEWFLLMGADAIASIDQWHDPAAVLRLATPAVVQRAGEAPPSYDRARPFLTEERYRTIRQSIVPMPRVEISSTELRERVAQGRSIRFRTPEPVVHFIAQQRLYRPHESHA